MSCRGHVPVLSKYLCACSTSHSENSSGIGGHGPSSGPPRHHPIESRSHPGSCLTDCKAERTAPPWLPDGRGSSRRHLIHGKDGDELINVDCSNLSCASPGRWKQSRRRSINKWKLMPSSSDFAQSGRFVVRSHRKDKHPERSPLLVRARVEPAIACSCSYPARRCGH